MISRIIKVQVGVIISRQSRRLRRQTQKKKKTLHFYKYMYDSIFDFCLQCMLDYFQSYVSGVMPLLLFHAYAMLLAKNMICVQATCYV